MHAGALTLPSYPDLFVWANGGRAVMPLAAVESDATVIVVRLYRPLARVILVTTTSTVLQRALMTSRLAVSSPARTRSAP